MNRREFIAVIGATTAVSGIPAWPQPAARSFRTFPDSVLRNSPYVEHDPIDGYQNASSRAYEAFEDMKFGARIHWGIYSIWHRGNESWPFLKMSMEDRQAYNQLYKTWNPSRFDASNWMTTFKESGMKMFAFTSKHHEGFCMFDTKTRVKSRSNCGRPRAVRRLKAAISRIR